MDSAMGSSVALSAGTPAHKAARPQTHDSAHRNTKIISLRLLVFDVLFTVIRFLLLIPFTSKPLRAC